MGRFLAIVADGFPAAEESEFVFQSGWALECVLQDVAEWFLHVWVGIFGDNGSFDIPFM